MKSHTKVIIFFALLAMTALAAPAAAPKKVYCTAKDRNPSTACYEKATLNACAYYKQDCPFDFCGRSAYNPCEACQDNNTVYYVLGDCKPSEVVNQCPEYDRCLQNPQEGVAYAPVCGIRNDTKKGDITTTFNNACQACKSSKIGWFQEGVCEDERFQCSANQRKANCDNAKASPVCAFFNDVDGVERFVTVKSSCNACKDSAVKYYKTGACGVDFDNATHCLPNVRPGACTREYNPVCGFFDPNNNVNGLDHKIYGNPCTACSDSQVIRYLPGPCVFQCKHNPFLIVECSGTFVQPVCGTTKVNGTTKKVSLQNSCIACNNAPVLIDTYTDGLCPGDEGVECKNFAGGFAQGQISPVCGVTKRGCNSTSCQVTYSEARAACDASSVLLFKPGKCPGDEGISCAPYRAAGPNSGINSLGFEYSDVCGYTKKGCTSSSCRSVYANQTVACNNKAVLFFTEGPCK